MRSGPSIAESPAPGRFPVLAAAAAGLIALAALLGPVLGLPWLGSLGRGLVVLAPLSGAMFLGLASAVLMRGRGRGAAAVVLAAAVAGLSLAVLLGYAGHGGLERLLAVRRMSVLTALVLLAAAAAALAGGSGSAFRRRLSALAAITATVLCAVVLLSYVAGAPLLYESRQTPMSLPAALAGLLLGLALLALAARGWLLALFRAAAGEAADPGRSARGPLALFLILLLAILVGGTFYLRGQLRAARAAAEAELAGIADLKAGQIGNWYRERLEDARQVSKSALLRGHFQRFLAGREDGRDLRAWLEQLRGAGQLRRLVLFDGGGRARMMLPEAGGLPEPGRVAAALGAAGLVVEDLHREPGGGGIHLSLWAPIEPGNAAGGLLLLDLDARPFLFPLVQSWPRASASAETLLVRRDGGDVVYLNELRHRHGTALVQRFGLRDNPGLPAARAVLGFEGQQDGIDYRGEPVLAAVRRVPGTPWSMVAKIDEAEVFGPLRRQGRTTGAALLALVLAAAMGTGLLLHQREAAWAGAQLAREQELRVLDGHYVKLSQLYAALSQVNQAIVWTRSGDELFVRICEVLVQFGQFKMAWIGCKAEAGAEVPVLAQCGDHGGYLRAATIRHDDSPEGRGPVGRAIREEQACIFNDFLAIPEALPWQHEARRCGFEAVAAFPIRRGGRVWGALAVYNATRGCFGEQEVLLLMEAATDISFALDHLDSEDRRRRAEAELAASEERLRMLFDSSPVGYLILDAQARLLDVNATFLDLLGYDREETIGRSLFDFAEPGSVDAMRELFQVLTAEGRIQGAEFRLVTGAGGVLDAGFEGRVSHDEAGRFLQALCTVADISGRLRAEAEHRDMAVQLHQSQKMESLGSLAGGIAHDINNVLAAILGLASAHRENMEPGAPLAGALDIIATACLRGRDVVRSLLYFSRKDLVNTGTVDLNLLVRDLVRLLDRTTLTRIRLETDLEEALPGIPGDAGGLSNVLMNLCVNAIDAMPGGGAILISSRSLADGRIQVSVKDTGAGMAPEVRARAMEPFYTTKALGKGTGLGLSMAFGTMKSHGGSIEIHSAPGEGTEVLLSFPAPAGSAQAPAPAPAAAVAAVRDLGILLVDDDELVRSAVVPMLELMGHRVRMAASGLEAVGLLREGLQVDLVILDMNMPGLDGAETLDRILDLRPGHPVLMASGYNDHDMHRILKNNPSVRSISKPFNARELQAELGALGR